MSEASLPAAFEYDFFIVHAGPAMDTAEELYERLHGVEGASAFLDKNSITDGSMSWGDELGGALRSSRIAVVLLTKGGDQPFYVNEEIHLAVLYHRQYGTPLIVPVYLGGTSPGPESPYGLYGIQSIVDQNGDLDSIATRLLDRLEGHRAEFPAPITPELQGPQDLIVEPGGGHGTVATIGRALAKAGAGSTIRIRPGLYDESLTITQPVHLVGEGPRSSIIVQSFNATALTFAASGGSVRGITVRQQGGTFPYQAIDISTGMPEIEDCVIVGGTRSALRVRGTSTPIIRGNEISGTSSLGIEIGDFASPTVSGNTIESLAERGVWVGGRAHPRIEGNVIGHCGGSGVWIGQESRVTLSKNTIQDCGDGVVVSRTGYATVTGNRILASRRRALAFTDEAGGVVTGNLLKGSGGSQVHLDTQSPLIFDSNTIKSGRSNGVTIETSGPEASIFTHNLIAKNQWSGAHVMNEALAKFRENVFTLNRDNGIAVHSKARGTYESNVICENGQNGVSVFEAGGPTFVMNLIHDNNWSGIFVSGGTAQLDRNHVYDNGGSAVTMTGGAAPRLKENDLSAESNAAVLALDASEAYLSRNHIHDSEVGVEVRRGALRIAANTIDDNNVGLRTGPGVDLTLELNSFCGNNVAVEDGGGQLTAEEAGEVLAGLPVGTSVRRVPGFVDHLHSLDHKAWGAPKSARSAP